MEAINGNGIAHTNELSLLQKEMIQKLRERVPQLSPEENDDNSLVKWLIARNYDLDKAEDMLRKHLRFYKTYGLDGGLEKLDIPEVADYFYTAMLGYDKEGSVVRILNVGASDLRGMSLSLSKTDCLKHALHILLTDMQKQKKDKAYDTYCDKQVYILDLQSLSFKAIVQRAVADRALLLLKSYEANLPERLKIAYIVNAPSFFAFIYNWLKGILPESIISKIAVLSEEECKSILLEKIDPSILPACIGGTRKDPDEVCSSLYRKPFGTPVPENYLPTDQLEILKNDPEAKKTIVEYKTMFILEKLVTEPNSTLMWDFQTTDYDIRMALRYRQGEDSEPEEIIPSHRVESHIIPESGNFQCENPGIYELVFDNTYSWMTNKELIFKINLQPPHTKDIN